MVLFNRDFNKEQSIKDIGFGLNWNEIVDNNISSTPINVIIKEDNATINEKTTIKPLIVDNSVKEKSSDVVVEDVESQKKNKKKLFAGLLAIPFVNKMVEKRKNKRNISFLEREKRRKQNRIAFGAISLAIITTITGVIFGGGLGRKTDKNEKNDNNREKVSTICNPIDNGKHTDDEVQMILDYYENIEIKTVDSEEEKGTNDDVRSTPAFRKDYVNHKNSLDNDITFGDIVNVNENAFIYTNCYDAAAATNGLAPYFDTSMSREVTGIAYNLNGQIEYIYASDDNCMEKEQELMKQGAVKVSYLTGNYEGYYNANDVNEISTNSSINMNDHCKVRVRTLR